MPIFLRKLLKYTGYFLLSFVVFIGGYLLAAYCLSRIAVNEDVLNKKEIAIYIKTNGVHTDIVVPTKNELMNWSTIIKYSNTTLNDTTMLSSEKGFYGFAFLLALFGGIAVQKNTRDNAENEKQAS